MSPAPSKPQGVTQFARITKNGLLGIEERSRINDDASWRGHPVLQLSIGDGICPWKGQQTSGPRSGFFGTANRTTRRYAATLRWSGFLRCLSCRGAKWDEGGVPPWTRGDFRGVFQKGNQAPVCASRLRPAEEGSLGRSQLPEV